MFKYLPNFQFALLALQILQVVQILQALQMLQAKLEPTMATLTMSRLQSIYNSYNGMFVNTQNLNDPTAKLRSLGLRTPESHGLFESPLECSKVYDIKITCSTKIRHKILVIGPPKIVHKILS